MTCHYESLRALGVEKMSDTEVYQARETIGRNLIYLQFQIREYADHIETRSRASAQREYYSAILARLESVVHP